MTLRFHKRNNANMSEGAVSLDDWITLPQLARELNIAESTARRWASSFQELLPSKGRGSGRRFHPQAREVLRRAHVLFESGLTTEQVSDVLHREFAATFDIEISETRTHEQKNIGTVFKQYENALMMMAEEQRRLREEMNEMYERMSEELEAVRKEVAATRAENERLHETLEQKLAERDKRLMETLRSFQEEKKKSWWKRLFQR
jgi:DNA-binding transcriptional MerR regulator